MATSYPQRTGIFKEGWRYLDRPEIQAWSTIAKAIRGVSHLGFGDHGCRATPWPPEGPSNPIAQVRYTSKQGCLLYRGQSLQQKGHDQMIRVSRELIQMSDYCGSGYSWGDAQIKEISSNGDRTGNRTSWISFETSHHIQFTAEQVAKRLAA